MKNIWMLSVIFLFAGCQPDVQESPAEHPAAVSKSDVQAEITPAAVKPNPPKEPAKIVPTPQSVKPVQPKAAPEQAAGKSEVAIETPVVDDPISEPAKTEQPAVIEQTPVAAPKQQMQLSEAEAMALAKKKNCFACHALDKKVVGPAWSAVADKYRNEADAQAVIERNVRKGGKGNWGSVAMPPQLALSAEELTGLVQFVRQLK